MFKEAERAVIEANRTKVPQPSTTNQGEMFGVVSGQRTVPGFSPTKVVGVVIMLIVVAWFLLH